MMEILLSLISAICIILGWIVHLKTERIKIMENQLSEKKYKAYAEVVAVFYNLLKDVKKKTLSNYQTTMIKMIESKKDIFLYGSDDVFMAFNKWLCATNDEQQSNIQMKYFLKFILEIRKDMCGHNTKISEYDIMVNLMQNEIEARKMLQLFK